MASDLDGADTNAVAQAALNILESLPTPPPAPTSLPTPPSAFAAAPAQAKRLTGYNNGYKRRLCEDFKNSGSCARSNGCTMAQGFEELKRWLFAPPGSEKVAGKGGGKDQPSGPRVIPPTVQGVNLDVTRDGGGRDAGRGKGSRGDDKKRDRDDKDDKKGDRGGKGGKDKDRDGKKGKGGDRNKRGGGNRRGEERDDRNKRDESIRSEGYASPYGHPPPPPPGYGYMPAHPGYAYDYYAHAAAAGYPPPPGYGAAGYGPAPSAYPGYGSSPYGSPPAQGAPPPPAPGYGSHPPPAAGYDPYAAQYAAQYGQPQYSQAPQYGAPPAGAPPPAHVDPYAQYSQVPQYGAPPPQHYGPVQ